MLTEPCALAGDAKVETPEGALPVRTLVGKNVSVFTREPSGRVRFRLMLDVRKLAEQQPVVKVTLETGVAFRVAPAQVLYKKGMVECQAATLHPGDELEPAFHYPEAYEYRDDLAATQRTSPRALRVTAVAADGVADLFTFAVNQTGCFFLTAGVLCKAAGSAPLAA